MTKAEFTKTLNEFHKNNTKGLCITFVHAITRLSEGLTDKIISSLWGCSEVDSFGENVYELIESSANSGEVEFNPKLRTKDCNIFLMYLDEHTAGFVLYKIQKT